MNRRQLIVLACATLAACSFRSKNEDIEPGEPVETTSVTSPEATGLLAEVARSETWTVDDFLAEHAPVFESSLPYDPGAAMYLDLVDASSFALDDDQMARLAADGFVVTEGQFPSFVYGYSTIYMEDLPVFVSADSVLFAIHRSYDAMLRDIELVELRTSLGTLLDQLRTRLKQGHALGLTGTQETDLDVYLAVAATLLGEAPRPTIVGGDQNLVDELVARALAAEGAESRALFGSERNVDWSQFEPRGHYAGIPELESYFRAMMWLGRIDFRMLEPNDQNQLEFRRRQFYDTIALWQLMDEDELARFATIHETIGAFVGEPDGLVVTGVPQLLEALGAEDAQDVKSMSDNEIATGIQKFGFGAQRIASHYMINGIQGTTKPLSYSLALFGQRYTIDAHVFSNVVWDRTVKMRMMPNPLDVAFAALGNNQAGVLLEPELRDFDYQHQLDAMRVISDAHGADFWEANLYNRWLGAVRTLSPAATPVPTVARTEAWGRRLLNTQLASWAELRHDTILYAKQSYTTGAACEYPDAYVEPNPAFFAAVVEFARHGREVTSSNGPSFGDYFDRLEAAALRLQAMAESQEAGVPHDADDIAWINQAVVTHNGCDGLAGAEGWYSELFYRSDEMDFDPTIADVHTQPTDESGNEVGRILHVGTGNARAVVVTVDTCEGPRAYVGLASTYYEAVTENFERLTDETWAPLVNGSSLVPPDWAP